MLFIRDGRLLAITQQFVKRADEQIDFTSVVVQVTRNTNRTLAIVVHDRYFDPVFLPQFIL